jgi:hypothetical protein
MYMAETLHAQAFVRARIVCFDAGVCFWLA